MNGYAPFSFRKIAGQLYRDGADGVMPFNFFAQREGGKQLPLELLDELGDPAEIRSVSK